MEHRALDPRSPFVLDTHELGRRPGTMRTVDRTVPAPEDLGTAVIGVPAGSDLELDLRLEAVMEGILVSGTVRGGTVGECVRCLDEVVDTIDVALQELYVYPERARVAVEDGDDEEDLRELEGDLVDLEPAVRDAVVPALPFRPVVLAGLPGPVPAVRGPAGGPGQRRAQPRGHRSPVGRRWPTCSTTRKRADRGCSEAQDVAQQHPCASVAVEDDRSDPHHVPALQGRQAAARGVPGVRCLQRPAVRRGAAHRARGPLTRGRRR